MQSAKVLPAVKPHQLRMARTLLSRTGFGVVFALSTRRGCRLSNIRPLSWGGEVAADAEHQEDEEATPARAWPGGGGPPGHQP